MSSGQLEAVYQSLPFGDGYNWAGSGSGSSGRIGGHDTYYPYPCSLTTYDSGDSSVLSYTDTMMGPWSFGYDQLNRLVTAQNGDAYLPGTPDPPARTWAPNFCWAYDAFGNRLLQATSDLPFASTDGGCSTSGSVYQNTWATYTSQNKMTSCASPKFHPGAKST